MGQIQWGHSQGAPAYTQGCDGCYTLWLRNDPKAPEGGGYYPHEELKRELQRGGGLVKVTQLVCIPVWF